ncbi:MAG: DUF411 domain-containing protein [Oleiphilaceae bacterium]|nr:DUF411 domain-containing protein [Oleiphilaceae bacterium]
MKYATLKILTCFLLVAGVVACSDQKTDSDQAANVSEQPSNTKTIDIRKQLTVYKTPTCGCCGEWVDHVQGSGFKTDVVNQDTVAHVKDRFGIPANARSCHTAVSDSGYVFEGHVPAKYMEEFLAEAPAQASGLLVPAMPLGSPGMEVDDKFQPYRILQLNKDGSVQIYASITSYEQQF